MYVVARQGHEYRTHLALKEGKEILSKKETKVTENHSGNNKEKRKMEAAEIKKLLFSFYDLGDGSVLFH